MDKKLPSITDENYILITLEFLESGKILKVGDLDVRRFELDLIVKNDITFAQLLEAIHQGFRTILLHTFKVNVDTDDTTFVYTDSREPKAESPTDEISSNENSHFLERIRIWREGRRWKKRRENDEKLRIAGETVNIEKEAEEKKLLAAGESIDSKQSMHKTLEKEDQKSNLEKDLKRLQNDYLVCWNVFLECYDAYHDMAAKHGEPTELEYIKYDIPRKPAIGISSIDYNKISFGEELCRSDRFQICRGPDYDMVKLKDLGFITTTRLIFDPIGWHTSAALFDKTRVVEAFQESTPRYNISDRPLRRLDNEPIQIIPPTEPPERGKINLLSSLLSPVLMASTMIAVRYYSSGGNAEPSLLLMSGSMAIVSIVVAFANWIMNLRNYKRSLREWRQQYQTYIQQLLTNIQNKQADDVQKLQALYPPAHIHSKDEDDTVDLVSKAMAVNGDIFSRGQEHPDFLTVRIGVSAGKSELVPSVFPIEGEKKEVVFASVKYHNIKNISGYPFGILLPHDMPGELEDGSTGFLTDLPLDIAREYAYLKEAPVLLNLKHCGALGIVFDKQFTFYSFLSNILLELCFYHSPDDLQCVMLCEESGDWTVQQNVIRRFKHLPHFRELLGDLSAFAFNKTDAHLIFNKLLEILSDRKKSGQDAKYPHILVIVLEEYELKRHPVSEYLPEFNPEKKLESKYGISFIFCKRYSEELPKYCGQVIKRNYIPKRAEAWFLLPHTQMVSRSSSAASMADEARYSFFPDELPPDYKPLGIQERTDDYYRAFKSISALHYERIAQGVGVPSSVDLFDIIGNPQEQQKEAMALELQDYIYRMWGKRPPKNIDGEINRDTTKMLAVPIGKKSGEIVKLDLHEKGDGPHMLVAGTTGSGKTETILTFLIGLCTFYTPEEVNLLLMDMKGAGFVQRIGQDKNMLPHVVGTVTDISGDETGTGTAYMLKRFLHSMNAEVKRRKVLLNRMDVDSVDGYTEAKKDLEKHISLHSRLKMEDLEELKKMPCLPHLFLVIDEFTELMQFSSENDDVDFRKAISSLARVGRSLGFHIILISQNIEGAITPEVEVNSRARLCLKVATREASRGMLGTDLAASPLMPGNGRAYLLVGTGSRFEYFQSGYSGADINRNLEAPIVITHAKTSGTYELFYNSEALECEKEKIDTSADSKKTGVTQLKMLVDQIRTCYDAIKRETPDYEDPHCVFQQPLPSACFYEYDWKTGKGNYKILKMQGE